MKAIAVVPGTKDVRLVERPEPSVNAPDDVKLRVLEVGICGTDREEVSGNHAVAPRGRKELVIGHEMIGEVVEVGTSVVRVRPGDHAVLTVRRGCGKCLPCAMDRPDMCRTGEYEERGIKGMDGYQTEYVVDKERHAVRIPPELGMLGVLAEPLSVVEKAIDEAVRLQSTRLPDAPATPQWLYGRRCLVAGLGPIGLLASLVLRLRGARVYGMDVVDPGTARPQWLTGIEGFYIDGRKITPDKVDDLIGSMDLVFEATGVPSLGFSLLDALGINGVYVLTGVPGGDSRIQVPGAEIIRHMVLNNQLLVGSVNAARGHFEMAVNDLMYADLLWKGKLKQLVTHRFRYADFEDVFHKHTADEIKVVLQWAA